MFAKVILLNSSTLSVQIIHVLEASWKEQSHESTKVERKFRQTDGLIDQRQIDET